MKVAVIGVGHVGLVSAGCLARWGHDVVGMDDNPDAIATLRRGGVQFHEPGLPELVAEGVASGRLRFTDDPAEAFDHAEVAFVCVGTPPLPGGAPNLAYVEKVGHTAASHATRDLVLVEKSTVPASTGVRLLQSIGREQSLANSSVRIDVASNPEFLREGSAVEDTLRPDRIVIGAESDRARDALLAVYEPLLAEHPCPVLVTDLATAELIKHASNAFLATKISFINAVARVCELVGADVEQVADGMGLDHRIGRQFLNAGLGYGGSCFPKDVDAFLHLARAAGYDFPLLDEVRRINGSQRTWVIDRLRAELWHLQGKTVALLGAAFKPGTDDLREAPAIDIAGRLLDEGATVRVYDPVALHRVKDLLPAVQVVEDPLAACRGAHAAVVCTEWPEVAAITPAEFAEALNYPIVIDGRNVFDPATMSAAGIRYHSVGRPIGTTA